MVRGTDLHAGAALMDGQVGQAVFPGGEAVGGAAGKPGQDAAGEVQGSIGGAEGAVAGENEEEDVEVWLGVCVYVLPGWQVDEVGVELASAFGQLPHGSGGRRDACAECPDVAQDARAGGTGSGGSGTGIRV